MDWTNIGTVVIGLLGILLTSVLANTGEHVIGSGALLFDPVIAAMAGFVFVVVWGILSIFGWDTPIIEALGRAE